MGASLKPCPACSRAVSPEAAACPHCGQPISAPRGKTLQTVGALIVIFAALGLCASFADTRGWTTTACGLALIAGFIIFIAGRLK